jgi:hypothetical protein
LTRTDELRRGLEHSRHSARELLAGSIGSDPYARIEEMRECGSRKAEAEGVAYQLEHETKSVLARLSSEYATTHNAEALSEAKLQRMALADPRYVEHVRMTGKAVARREHARGEYWAIRSELEWDRASVAHLNALSRLEEPV